MPLSEPFAGLEWAWATNRMPRPFVKQHASWFAFVVNLDRRYDRARRILTLLRFCPEVCSRLQRVPAVDGRAVDPRVLLREGLLTTPLRTVLGSDALVRLDWMHITSGALGCALSHLGIWRHMAKLPEDDSWALVIEDDLVAVAPDLDRRLPMIVQGLPPDWDLCYVGSHGDAAFDLLLAGSQPEAAGDVSLTKAERVEVFRGEHPTELVGSRLGTFAYLVSARGARRLLATGVVFPLQRQLDQELNLAIADGKLCTWATPEHDALFFSPPFHCADSDVQPPWGPDDAVEKKWQSRSSELQAAVKARLRVLDAAASEVRGAFGRAEVTVSSDSWKPLARRRCVVYSIRALPGQIEDLTGRLLVSVASLRATNVDAAALVLWYGDDCTAAARAEAKLHNFSNVALIFRGSYEDVAEEATRGETSVDTLAPSLVSLRFFQSFVLDQLFLLDQPLVFASDVAAIFDRHCDEDVYVSRLDRGGDGVEASFSQCVLLNAEAWLRLVPWLHKAAVHGDLLETAGKATGERLRSLVAGTAVHLASLSIGCFDGPILSPMSLPADLSLESFASVPPFRSSSGLPVSKEVYMSLLLQVPLELLRALDWQ